MTVLKRAPKGEKPQATIRFLRMQVRQLEGVIAQRVRERDDAKASAETESHRRTIAEQEAIMATEEADALELENARLRGYIAGIRGEPLDKVRITGENGRQIYIVEEPHDAGSAAETHG